MLFRRNGFRLLADVSICESQPYIFLSGLRTTHNRVFLKIYCLFLAAVTIFMCGMW
jgi:hypothetical protein